MRVRSPLTERDKSGDCSRCAADIGCSCCDGCPGWGSLEGCEGLSVESERSDCSGDRVFDGQAESEDSVGQAGFNGQAEESANTDFAHCRPFRASIDFEDHDLFDGVEGQGDCIDQVENQVSNHCSECDGW